MKIAVWHNLPSGGGKRALYQHIQGLIERGHTVEAWCPPSADQHYLPLSQIIPEHVLPCRPIRWVPAPTQNPFSQLFASYRNTLDRVSAMDEHCRRCAVEINNGGFDVLLSGICMYLAVAPIGRYVQLPKAIYLQEPFRVFYEALPRLPWVALSPNTNGGNPLSHLWDYLKDLISVQGLRVQAREELNSAATYNTILVNSRFSRESVLRAYGLDARVCYLGIDTNLFVDKGLPRENFVMGVGSITPAKNIKFVLDSIARLPEPRPSLVWVGNMAHDSHQRELEAYAQSLGVTFVPKVDVADEVLVDLLNRATVVAYAPRLEPFGYIPLEANACGAPVVGVAEGGLRESITHGVNGLLVENAPQQMADAIQSLIANPQLARQLGQAGRAAVKSKWTLASATDRLESSLLEIVNNAKR